MASAEAQAQASKPGVPENFMHKNRLQEYTQRSSIPLPLYQTVNEGTQHAPKFRATVFVDGATYWATQTFSNRKAAEQDVARLALEGISRKIKDEGCPLVREDTVFCKSILNEFAVKMNLEKPTYATSQPEGLLPVFISSLVFNGRSYSGTPGRNKREAEQLAARTVILSILGDSDSGTLLSQIIKSKSKLYAALQYVNQPGASHDMNVAYGGSFVNSGGNSLGAGSNSRIMPTTGNMLQLSVVNHPQALPSSGQPTNAQVALQALPQLKKPKEEHVEVSDSSTRSAAEVANVPLASLPALASGPALASVPTRPINVASQHILAPQHLHQIGVPHAVPLVGPSAVSMESQAVHATIIGSKRSRKNKKNISKKVRTEEQ